MEEGRISKARLLCRFANVERMNTILIKPCFKVFRFSFFTFSSKNLRLRFHHTSKVQNNLTTLRKNNNSISSLPHPSSSFPASPPLPSPPPLSKWTVAPLAPRPPPRSALPAAVESMGGREAAGDTVDEDDDEGTQDTDGGLMQEGEEGDGASESSSSSSEDGEESDGLSEEDSEEDSTEDSTGIHSAHHLSNIDYGVEDFGDNDFGVEEEMISDFKNFIEVHSRKERRRARRSRKDRARRARTDGVVGGGGGGGGPGEGGKIKAHSAARKGTTRRGTPPPLQKNHARAGKSRQENNAPPPPPVSPGSRRLGSATRDVAPGPRAAQNGVVVGAVAVAGAAHPPEERAGGGGP